MSEYDEDGDGILYGDESSSANTRIGTEANTLRESDVEQSYEEVFQALDQADSDHNYQFTADEMSHAAELIMNQILEEHLGEGSSLSGPEAFEFAKLISDDIEAFFA